MKLKLLESSTEAASPNQFLTSLLVNETVAIDAGSLGFTSLEEQQRVRDLLISHTHIDHLASLPIFLENIYGREPGPVTIHAGAATMDSLRSDLFNDRVWPDLFRIGRENTPFFETSRLDAESPVELGGVRITPVEVPHGIPTFGFVLEQGGSAVAVASDTAPTQRLWEVARNTGRLKAVFLDCSFPNVMSSLAEVSYHLTPELFAREVAKVDADVRVYALHIKARFRDEVVRELQALGRAELRILRPGEELEL